MLPAASELGLSQLIHVERVASTMDEAHRLAEDGAPPGTCIVADEQTAGRGRAGRQWVSEEHRGVWLTLLERPADAEGLDVLSLRCGLVIARALEELDANAAFRLKWPNDVFRNARKVAGVLIEARWREQALEWVAIGVGINLSVPAALSDVASLTPGITRTEVLHAIVPALRHAAARGGVLDSDELAEWHRRDFALGRRIASPHAGIARGVTSAGALRVDEGDERIVEIRSGSLVLVDD